MRTYQEKAEAYVRQQLPELMELNKGCLCYDPKAIDWARDLEILTYTPKGHVYFREPDGSVFHATSSYLKQIEIIGHPIQLQHWLRVLGENTKPDALITLDIEGNLSGYRMTADGEMNEHLLTFNLTTGQPATEADYQAFCEIVGINQD